MKDFRLLTAALLAAGCSSECDLLAALHEAAGKGAKNCAHVPVGAEHVFHLHVRLLQ